MGSELRVGMNNINKDVNKASGESHNCLEHQLVNVRQDSKKHSGNKFFFSGLKNKKHHRKKEISNPTHPRVSYSPHVINNQLRKNEHAQNPSCNFISMEAYSAIKNTQEDKQECDVKNSEIDQYIEQRHSDLDSAYKETIFYDDTAKTINSVEELEFIKTKKTAKKYNPETIIYV